MLKNPITGIPILQQRVPFIAIPADRESQHEAIHASLSKFMESIIST
jgi:hypothetical protein